MDSPPTHTLTLVFLGSVNREWGEKPKILWSHECCTWMTFDWRKDRCIGYKHASGCDQIKMRHNSMWGVLNNSYTIWCNYKENALRKWVEENKGGRITWKEDRSNAIQYDRLSCLKMENAKSLNKLGMLASGSVPGNMQQKTGRQY